MENMLRRAGIGMGIVALGASMAFVPMASAGASKPGWCSLDKAEAKVTAKSTAAMTKAIESGNWAAAKAALLASFSQETQAEQAAIASLASAPSNVRAAGNVLLKFVGTQKALIQKSTSATQFASSEEAAIQGPKFAGAEKTLSAYYVSKCGPIITTPTT
jgi:uncharacterized protein YyaL (SSP411 family)